MCRSFSHITNDALEVMVRVLVEADSMLTPPPEKQSLQEAFSSGDEDRVEEIVRKVLKTSASEAVLLKVTKNVLVSLFKALYTKRGFWKDSLSASNSD